MMKPKVDYYVKVIETLKTLKKEFPTYEISQHISTATSEYQDVWGITDRQMYDLLEKYRFDLHENSNLIAPSSDVDKIIREGLNLDNILDEEDEDY